MGALNDDLFGRLLWAVNTALMVFFVLCNLPFDYSYRLGFAFCEGADPRPYLQKRPNSRLPRLSKSSQPVRAMRMTIDFHLNDRDPAVSPYIILALALLSILVNTATHVRSKCRSNQVADANNANPHAQADSDQVVEMFGVSKVLAVIVGVIAIASFVPIFYVQ